MTLPGMRFAHLDDDRLAVLRTLEEELGVYVLALEPDTYRLAQLDADQLQKLRTIEEELGVILVAYRPKTA
jgi:hypothetical protein